jgi:hypothetical protein
MSGAHTDLLAVPHVGRWPPHWLSTPHGIEGAESGLGGPKGKVRAMWLLSKMGSLAWLGGRVVACVQSEGKASRVEAVGVG